MENTPPDMANRLRRIDAKVVLAAEYYHRARYDLASVILMETTAELTKLCLEMAGIVDDAKP